MAFDGAHSKPRDLVAETMDRLYAKARRSEPSVPEHLKGSLFSQRDLQIHALKAIDEEMAAFMKGVR